MSKPTDVPDRLRTIAADIYGAATTAGMAFSDQRDAQSALDEAKDAAGNAREKTLGMVAAMSRAGNWTEGEIKAATKLAAKMGNALEDKSLATFIAETRRAAHPKARNYFTDLVDARNAAWDAEDALKAVDKAADTPLRRCFARRYHTLIRQLGEVAETGTILDTADKIVEFARDNDPAHDAAKVLAKVEALRDQLAAISGKFPDPALLRGVAALTEVDEVTLKAAWLRATHVTEPLSQAEVVTPASTTEALGDMPEGVADVWGDLMQVAA